MLPLEATAAGHSAKRWTEHREKGRFSYIDHVLQVSPYELDVTKATKAWFSVHQQDTREHSAQPYIDIGLTVLAADRKTLVASTGIDVDRQVQLEVELPIGLKLLF